MKIAELVKKYCSAIDFLDLEILIAHELEKTREFVLARPEYELTKNQELKIKNLIARRRQGEPLAYILGQKEFFGLNFKVNRHTLIPRPETELLVELALQEIASSKNKSASIMDVGTGSGSIIISLAKSIAGNNKFYATDISQKALAIAKNNVKKHKVGKKIKFLHGNLLEPILKSKNYKPGNENCIILANLPYLSKEIYSSASPNVKKYEPKSALYSPREGLAHYEKLFKQIKLLVTDYQLLITCFLEISPEQKPKIGKFIKAYFPKAKIAFIKDLAGKWRVCEIKI